MIIDIFDRIRTKLEDKDTARERSLAISRDIVRNCRTAMFDMHKGKFEKATVLLETSKRSIKDLSYVLEEHPDVYYSGFVEHAQQEYVECSIVFELLRHGVETNSIPGPEELKVEYAAYLNGLGDVNGELRRHILDLLRKERAPEAEKFLDTMEEIYTCLMMFDFPDAMTRGLRHKTDTTRAILERTRGDVSTAIRQLRLENAMREFERRTD
ncbi:haloacid dehalogenase [Methanolobus halotolerans]|uniref:Haloacid dehalogenase n=1 Tax=Methanolobus halotolerans TaxID=2052935 RepID=A0A4E0QSD7_9EURY|nr:haloacid dehalogenase [Methanolobus halotolerans]TGC09828.1 haloacid dehalogenase [Methanolobus halotolerans]